MKYTLEQFNILYEQIQDKFITQKKHGFLHKLRPFARKKVYIEQDFMQLWNTSAFKKMKYAFNGIKLNFKFDEQPYEIEDVYQGTDRPGVLVKYKILPQYQKYLITQLLQRLKDNSDNDYLATWRSYLELDLEDGNINLPMQLHVISQVKPKPNQSFQNDKNIEIQQFNHAGYDGNIYIWFDFSKFKQRISASLDNTQQKFNQKLIQQQEQQGQQVQKIQDATKQDESDFHLTNPIQDKIKIGSFNITIKDSDKEGLIGVAKHFAQGDISQFIGHSVTKAFNRIRGKGQMKDKSEDPDFVRKRIGLYDTSKPFIECISSVTLQKWLYNLTDDPQKKYLGSTQKKVGITAIVKLPFDLRKIKRSGDPLLSDDIYSNQCWSAGQQEHAYSWNRKPITKEWLLNNSFDQHKLTLKFESWVKTEQGYYFEYRVQLNISEYYKLEQSIAAKQEELQSLANTQRQKRKIQLRKQISDMKSNIGNFESWFKRFFKDNLQMSGNTKGEILITKSLFDSKGNMLNKAGTSKTRLAEFKGTDLPAFYFLQGLLTKKWTCQGENLYSIMDKI